MTNRVLILGGCGRIGRSVAADLATHTQVQMTMTSRSPEAKQNRANGLIAAPWAADAQYLTLDLSDRSRVEQAIANTDLVIHCAGPFRYRDDHVLRTCIKQGVNYLDVSDDRSFTHKALALRHAAQAAGVTAIINSGVFPGISNSMVRQGVERLDVAERIHLSYVVAGSGGAGITVLRTTFLGLQHPFEVWLDRHWHSIKPYTEREAIEFPAPFGRVGVYWFDMPEVFTLPETYPVNSVIVKFGSAPDLYNHLTALVANQFPLRLVQHSGFVEFLAHVSHAMTAVTDRFSGVGVAMRAEISGEKAGRSARYCSTFVHDHTATAAGYGTGSLAQLLLSETLSKPGVWAVEQSLPTNLFEQAMQSRGVAIEQAWL